MVRLHRMHEMQTIVNDVCGVCLSVMVVGQSVCHVTQLGGRPVQGSFGTAFASAKSFWPFVNYFISHYLGRGLLSLDAGN